MAKHFRKIIENISLVGLNSLTGNVKKIKGRKILSIFVWKHLKIFFISKNFHGKQMRMSQKAIKAKERKKENINNYKK